MLQKIVGFSAALIAFPFCASANDACPVQAITTKAAVTTSDGDEYEVRTTYRSAQELVAQFIGEAHTTIAVEGPFVWARSGETDSNAGDAERRFAIGHQYHAMLMHFDTIMIDVEEDEAIAFDGAMRRGRTGTYPAGGKVSLVDGERAERPAGMVMALPDETAIIIRFGGWRAISDSEDFPHEITIEHEGAIYNYRYTQIDVNDMDAIDFHERYAAPALDKVQIHRLHRALLATHCRGDAELMSELSTPETVIANRGDVIEATREETRKQFDSVFSRLDYTGYHDVKAPQIDVAESGDLGWAVVNVRAEGVARESDTPFSQRWAWAMLARKVDGVWLSAGNASNYAPS